MDFFVCFLSIFLSEFSLYLTDQSCNKRGAENPPACVRACLIFFIVAAGMIGLCKRFHFLNLI